MMPAEPEPPPSRKHPLAQLPGLRLSVLLDGLQPGKLSLAGLDEEFVERFCKASLDAQIRLAPDEMGELELSVQLLDEPSMLALNQQYRGKNSATNVLSFPADMPLTSLAELRVLGDLVLCPSVIEREACEQNKPLLDHWAHMLVHGTLHLCGYDHEEPSEAESMESLETQILSKAGIPDPYQEALTHSVNNLIGENNE